MRIDSDWIIETLIYSQEGILEILSLSASRILAGTVALPRKPWSFWLEDLPASSSSYAYSSNNQRRGTVRNVLGINDELRIEIMSLTQSDSVWLLHNLVIGVE